MFQRKNYTPILCAGCMLALILDSKGSLSAGSQAIELCLRTAIPSLFPFFVLSGLLVPSLTSLRMPFLSKLLGIPAGWEVVFLLSCAGGYPVGAQCIAQGYRSGHLNQTQARRMLGFCNNCGPAFLFGVVGPMFPSVWYAIALTGCGVLAAALVGSIWPDPDAGSSQPPKLAVLSLPQAVNQAISSMASVCAWIVLGKILLHFLSRCLLLRFSPQIQVLLGGLIELTNGCLSLSTVADVSTRFLMAATLLPFGGLCVAMQVQSICAQAGLSTDTYLMQKLLQGLLSMAMAYALLRGGLFAVFVFGTVLLVLTKKTLVFLKETLYNGTNKGGEDYAVPKEN